MAKYDPLYHHLSGSPDSIITMSLDELAELVGGLPVSARKHRAWWANEVAGRHVQARAWMAAHYQVSDLVLGKTVTFTGRGE